MRDRRYRTLLVWIGLGLVAWLPACERSHAEPRRAAPRAQPPPGAAPRAAGLASGALTWRGDFCDSDSHCGWDDPCRPTRCQKATAPTGGCHKSVTPPGDCRCVEHQCTLKPRDPGHGGSTRAGCRRDSDCFLDVPTATCHLGGKDVLGSLSLEGPFCRCDRKTQRCAFQWAAPVPCKSWKDCWYERQPRLRPVRASKPRTRRVRPCKDGEIDSLCLKGFCRVMAWDC